MQNSSQNNKRIAKNTMLLYGRMFLMMLIGLYTSRVVLNALGVEDYGIYNVVGGLVTMFSMLSGSLSAAISRFITYELGKENQDKLSRIFSASVTIQLLLSLIIVILAELIGVWFLNEKMSIPSDRMVAANAVLQISIITFVINLISVPYNAVIIAHERMSAFAYISILEAIGKLVIASLIVASPLDKLIFYAILMCALSVLIRMIYGFYCKRHFNECSYHFRWDKGLLGQMFKFAGWNFFGAGSALLMTQGVNMLMNMVFGVTINAARGVANQVDSTVQQFVNNFTTAINPQITKSYASEDLPYMHKLVCIGSKYSFFLTWFFALPLLLEADIVLKIWLKTVPAYAPVFLRLTLCISLISVVSNTLVTSMLATGNIKRYQLIVGGLGMCVFPLAYVAYKIGLPVESAYIIHLTIFLGQLACRLYLLKGMIKLKIRCFWNNVLAKDLKVVLLSCILPWILFFVMPPSLLRLIVIIIGCTLSNMIGIYAVGMTVNERTMVKSYINKIKEKF